MKGILKRSLFLVVCLISSSLFAQAGGTKVSEAEFTSFVSVIKELQKSGTGMQNELMQIVRAEGLTPERFNEIQYNMDSPLNEVKATNEELAAYKKIATEVDRLKAEQHNKLLLYLKEYGLTLKRYQEIAGQVQEDQELNERLISIITDQPSKN